MQSIIELATKRLVGTEEVSVDDRGRIQLSAKKAAALDSEFAAVQRPENCLTVFPSWRWEQILQQFLDGPAFDPKREQLLRQFFGGAEEGLSVDRQGRMLLPAKSRLALGLEPGVKMVVIGLGASMDVWRKSDWEEFLKYPEAYRQSERAQFQALWDLVASGRQPGSEPREEIV